MYITRIS